jgi:transcriptional regulator with XRE-family HTH domain
MEGSTPSRPPTPGQLLKDARKRHGVSQARLAIRAGTTQSVISRIERDGVSPSVETLRGLLRLLGEDLTLGTESRDWGIDRTQVRERLRATPGERVDQGLAFGEVVLDTHRSNAT